MSKVFVYGTLMRGKWNHYILKGSKLLGKARLKGYEMYNVSSFPGIVKGNGTVLGEAYEIDEPTLKILDRLESVGYLYNRETETAGQRPPG